MSKIAAIQMASGSNVVANLNEAAKLIAKAVTDGAKLVVLPENFALVGKSEQDKTEVCETEGEGEIQIFLSEQADKHHIWLVGGTIPLQASNPKKVRSACLVFNDSGELCARYDKIHLFDVSLSEREHYVESEFVEPGDSIVVIDSPFGRMGIAVCYDLRFPELFRQMLDKEMELLVLPAAFTASTGQAHWELLLRARAVENLCYVIASGQGGYHVNGRKTFGHSMIIDPWGRILAQLPQGKGHVCTNIDELLLKSTRKTFPVLSHRRLSCC